MHPIASRPPSLSPYRLHQLTTLSGALLLTQHAQNRITQGQPSMATSSAAISSNPQQHSAPNREELEEVLIPANPNHIFLARRILVGKIISEKPVNRQVAKELIAKAWTEFDKLQISDLGTNRFLFTFEDEQHCQTTIKKAPWFIMNHLMCVQYWIPEASPHEVYYDLNPF